jgi:ferredoxin
MKIEYHRRACSGWFQCVQEWDAFSMNVIDGKAEFENAEEADPGVMVRDVPKGEEEAAKAAAESCPVDAIIVYEDGEQIIPDSDQ